MCRELIEAKYSQYRVKICNFLLASFVDKCDEAFAKDVFHDGLMVIWLNCQMNENFKLTPEFDRLLWVICRNRVISLLRKANREKEINAQYYLCQDASIELEARNALFKQCIYEQLLEKKNQIGEPCRQILNLFYLNEKTWAQIVEILNIGGIDPLNNAKNRGDYCKKKLRKLINFNTNCNEFLD